MAEPITPTLHAVTDEHQCPDCDRTFAAAQALGVHRARSHGIRHGGNGVAKQHAKKKATAGRGPARRKSPTPAPTTPPPDTEAAIRRDERRKLADLLEEHGAALTAFTHSPERTLGLIVHLLRLG